MFPPAFPTRAMPRVAPFLILETGQPAAPLRRLGGFPHWIRVAAGLAADEAVVVNVQAGEPLPAREGFAGVLVTGSAAMVTERHPWSEDSAGWLREAAHAGSPLFGICYGHQLLAHALGGEVGDNPAGREMGTIALELHPQAAHDPLFAGLPAQFAAQATHLQSVLRAPDGATVLARSAQDDCHAFRWGQHAWGVQFHPEFSATHMRGYVLARREALAREGRDAATLAGSVRATPLARRVLRRFVRHARRATGGR
jgi:GMP synthase (glutamine-hydrolysing)